MNNFVDNCFESANRIDDIATDINRLARAFKTTGNDVMFEILYSHYSSLIREAGAIRNICKDKVDEDFQETQQNTANILNAALAGVKLAKKDEQK